MSLYDTDFHAWAHEQAALAKSRSGNALDWDNVAEELESLGKQQEAELDSRYIVLLAHLLKWSFQPAFRGRSWTATIKEQRRAIAKHIRKNPSLKAVHEDVFYDAFVDARLRASAETDLDEDVFPVEPPFTPEQALDPDFWPEPAVERG